MRTDDGAPSPGGSVAVIARDRTDEPAISVVIPTYNRCVMLAAALRSVLAQRGNVTYEVLVVDNNSTDGTADVIRRNANWWTTVDVKYIRETRQGAAHARNAGLSSARAPIIAFIDDDVWAAPDWVTTIKRVLDENPHVQYVGGRVLPHWPGQAPTWLTDAHWSPLAILDYGDKPFLVSAKQPVVLLGANLALRRTVFDGTGPFAANFQHLRDAVSGGTEDHELQLRIWAAGGRGLYVPEMVVTANIQPERLTRKYHRRWHTEHGILCSRLRVDEMIGSTGELLPHPQDGLQFFRVPAWLYRACIRRAVCWLWARLRRQSGAFEHEMRVRYYISYIRTRYTDSRIQGPHTPAAELTRFLAALLRKKVGIRRPARHDPPARGVVPLPRPAADFHDPDAEPTTLCDRICDVRR